ncbi:hypothetical protein DdX_14861 [Ditylenchus destructor]|uniref:Uncharacterized protein n=1 Tax=Ditylenchus destructor TaxID=166010 RepID=A0AAD4MTA6_9BILA|nr:hypothetical protein DdX_14861 [Ditylenchus destructor]
MGTVDILSPDAPWYSGAQLTRTRDNGRLICDTVEDFPDVPMAAFMVDDGRSVVPCPQIPPLDLNAWREVL